MKNLIENICFVCIIISTIGLIVSYVINNITTFIFSALFMFAFLAIAIIDMSRE